MFWFRLARRKHQSVDLTITPPKASPVTKQQDPVTPQNQINRLVIGGGGGGSNGVGNGSVSMSREASTTSPSRGTRAQSPTLPAMVFSMCVVFLKFIPFFLLPLLLGRAIDI